MPNSLQSHELQCTRVPCPSLSPGTCSESCPLSQWCHPTFSSSVTHFSSCPQSSAAWGSFPMSWPFTSGGQSIVSSASAIVFSVNIQEWFPLGFTGLISLLPRNLKNFKSLLQHHSSKAPVLQYSAFFMVQLSHLYMSPGKSIGLTIQHLLAKWRLCFLIRCLGLS